MLKEVSKEVWIKALENIDSSIFDEPEYLEIIALLHQTRIKYWVVYKKDNAFIGFATHIRNKSIIVPDHYSYSSFWLSEEVGDYNFFHILDLALKELKGKFKRISFRLPPSITDIRAFNNNGFTTQVRYTYLNDTSNLKFRKDVSVKLNIANKVQFELCINEFNEQIIKQHVEDLRSFGFTKSKIKFYEKYFEMLLKLKFLKSYCLRFDNKILASSLIIEDLHQSKAYNLFLATSKRNVLNSSTKLYYEMMCNLNENGIKHFDLYGANMKNIANYKSGFNGKLIDYYTVNYSARNEILNFYKRKMKDFIKRFL